MNRETTTNTEDTSALPWAPLTAEELFRRQDEVARSIAIAVSMDWHRKPQYYGDLDNDAAAYEGWERAAHARFGGFRR